MFKVTYFLSKFLLFLFLIHTLPVKIQAMSKDQKKQSHEINAEKFFPVKIFGPFHRDIEYLQAFKASGKTIHRLNKHINKKRRKKLNLIFLKTRCNSYLNGNVISIGDLKEETFDKSKSGKLLIIDRDSGQKIYEITGKEILQFSIFGTKKPFLKKIPNNISYANIFEEKIKTKKRKTQKKINICFFIKNLSLIIDPLKKTINLPKSKKSRKKYGECTLQNRSFVESIRYDNFKTDKKFYFSNKKKRYSLGYQAQISMSDPKQCVNLIHLRDKKTPKLFYLEKMFPFLRTGHILKIIFSKKENFIIITHSSGNLLLFDLNTFKPALIKAFHRHLRAVAITPDEKYIIIAIEKKIYVYPNPVNPNNDQEFRSMLHKIRTEKKGVSRGFVDLKIICPEE